MYRSEDEGRHFMNPEFKLVRVSTFPESLFPANGRIYVCGSYRDVL